MRMLLFISLIFGVGLLYSFHHAVNVMNGMLGFG
jgi:hypothetical protein